MRTRLATAALAVVYLFLPGCAESRHPLGPLASAEQDTRLHGTWTLTEPGGKVQYLHIGREPKVPFDPSLEDPEPGLMRFWLISHEPDTGAVSNPFGLRGYRTQLGDTDYANCIVPPNYLSTPAKPLRYWFVKYRVFSDQLEIWSMDFKATGRVIEAGSLAGQTERDEDGELTRAFLTATTDELAAYLQNGGEQVLFPEDRRSTYHRQAKPPAARN